MTIIPQVNSQGLVNLQIKAEVSARGDDVTVGGQHFPSFNTQDAETSAVVNDGETLVIGGSDRREQDQSAHWASLPDGFTRGRAVFRRDQRDEHENRIDYV